MATYRVVRAIIIPEAIPRRAGIILRQDTTTAHATTTARRVTGMIIRGPAIKGIVTGGVGLMAIVHIAAAAGETTVIPAQAVAGTTATGSFSARATAVVIEFRALSFLG
ncbi:hypothetical protein A8C75_18575 [Marinobacterium aestuarii]|uniref:Uncharacterized protein n=1 Tax=Marinobacterium aestuarii TaxID=1821621 RepID=A0A1A9F315_9GAMM|nr:hypothetical protein A8C75_18575 [Marinobacterium aestuarii]